MHPRIILHGTIIAFLLAVAAITTPGARAAEKWLKLSSEHFDMLSCTGERDSKQLLVELEQFRMFFLSGFPATRAHDIRPLIFVFDTRSQFQKYSPLQPNGKVKELNGVFLASPTEHRIAMVNDQLEQGLRTIFHEYVHALVRARLTGKIPVWFNEGLAELYSSFEVRGDDIKTGSPHASHVITLNRTPLIPLPTFFAVDGSSKYYNENDKMNIFYAQAWALMHFIFCGTNNGAATSRSLETFTNLYDMPGITAQEAFEKSFGMKYKKLERLLDDYMRAGKYRYGTAKIPAKPIRDKITTRPATPAERDIELEGMLWRVRNSDTSEFKLLQMREKYPDAPRLCEILAEIKMRAKETAEAADYHRKAIEKNSQNALVYVWRLRDEFRGSSYPLEYTLPTERCEEYRRLVDKALELSPDCMEAYELLAMIESLSATMRIEKLNAVLKALQNMREKSKTHIAVATAYWRLKRYDEAEAVITALKDDPRSTNSEKRRAQELLRRIAKDTGKPMPPPLPREAPRIGPKMEPIKMPSLPQK